MSELIYSIINVPYLTTGRRLFALKQCLAAAAEKSPETVPLIEEAILHDLQTVALEQSWARSKNVSKARGVAVEIDNKIDSLLGAIYSGLKNNVDVLEPENSLHIASEKILAQLFPEGVQPIILKPFEEQLVLNAAIVQRLTGDLKDDIETVGMTPHVTRLWSLNESFRSELRNIESKEISYDEVEAAQNRGNLFIRRIVAAALGTHHQDDQETAALRRTLLAPILEQAGRVRESRRGRRRPNDIDSDTGQETGSDLPEEILEG